MHGLGGGVCSQDLSRAGSEAATELVSDSGHKGYYAR